jgi:penicillin-binding protein 2
VADYVSNPDESKEYLPRYKLFYILLAATFSIFFMRLWYLQIIEGEELRTFSEKNRVKQNKILAPRGLMVDRDGKTLVENHPGFEAILSPQYITNLDGVAQAIGPILGQEPEKIVQRVQRSRRQNGPFAQVRIKDNLIKDEVFRLKRIRLDYPGLEIKETVVRHFPMGYNGAQILGYVSEISKRQIPIYNEKYKGDLTFDQGDIIGKTGLEEVLEKHIRGKDGVQLIQVDAFGRETQSNTKNIYGEELSDREPTPGYNVVLTLDKDVQEAAWNSFESHKRIGALVAMKPNGEILAWVSAPSFDPNQFSQGPSQTYWNQLINDPFKPLRNKVIQDHYSPGSTFKAFIALASLQEKEINPTTIINCPGAFAFGRRLYHDHLKGGHGNITVYEALERSSNVFFYKMGIALGIDRMFNYVSTFGIGTRSGIELPREAPGLMPSAQWKKQAIGEEWQAGENLSVAIGQGFVTATPMQMAVAYSAIANKGKVYRPFIVKKIIDHDGKVVKENQELLLRDLTQKQASGISISPETFDVVREGLRRVVQGERGTAKRVQIPGVEIAGKTGTSQVMGFSADQIYAKCDSRPVHQRHHGWFIGWAPADKPEIVVAALGEHSCSGSGGAGPLVHDTMLAYFQKYRPDLIEAGKKSGKKTAAPTAQPQQEVPEGE